MPKEVRLTIWIILFVVIVAAFLFWVFYPLFKKNMMRKNHKRYFYKKVSKIANYGDYYLINGMRIHQEDPSSPSIDHLLIGNKYFYLIYDYYFEGAVDASLEDDYWIYLKANGAKTKIPNPLKVSEGISDYLSLVNSIDPSYMVTIVLINDDCFISSFQNNDGKANLSTLSKLEKLINSYESQNIGDFDGKALAKIVDNFAGKKKNARD